MPKVKYYYDSESLSFKKIKKSWIWINYRKNKVKFYVKKGLMEYEWKNYFNILDLKIFKFTN